MVRVLGHRQTKGAATDHPSLPPPRHISTLQIVSLSRMAAHGPDLSRSVLITASEPPNASPEAGRSTTEKPTLNSLPSRPPADRWSTTHVGKGLRVVSGPAKGVTIKPMR